jgi:hypothetical protein
LSTAAPGGLSNPFRSAEHGWIVGSQEVDPNVAVTTLGAVIAAFVGQAVDLYSGLPAVAGPSNAFLGGPPVDPSTGLPSAPFTDAGGPVNTSGPTDLLKAYLNFQNAMSAASGGSSLDTSRMLAWAPEIISFDAEPGGIAYDGNAAAYYVDVDPITGDKNYVPVDDTTGHLLPVTQPVQPAVIMALRI